MGRAPCCDKANVKKGPWSPEEDAKLKDYIEKFGTGGNWIALPQKAGLKRCGKSCRLRWLNYLRPNIKHGEFSDEEDRIICSLYASIGSRWSIIAAQLPGRTDNDIKNYWNTKLKKKLMAMNYTNVNNILSPHHHTKPSPTITPHNYHDHHHHHHTYPSMLSSSSSSSSPPLLSPSLSSSSPYQYTSTTFYNSPSPNTLTMSFSGNNINNNSCVLQPTPQEFMNMEGYQQVKDENTLLVFGGEQASTTTTTCSSSDQATQSSTSMCDYGLLEEIKQLISTNNNSFNNYFFDETKVDQETKVRYFY